MTSQPQQHCDNERICYLYREQMIGKKIKGPCRISPCNSDARAAAARVQDTMTLPEEMPFTPEEIQMKKFVITESQWKSLFDAWMRSDKDVRELHRIQNVLLDRIICVGNQYGSDCASCHKHKTSGYFICVDCFYNQTLMASTQAREKVLDELRNYLKYGGMDALIKVLDREARR